MNPPQFLKRFDVRCVYPTITEEALEVLLKEPRDVQRIKIMGITWFRVRDGACRNDPDILNRVKKYKRHWREVEHLTALFSHSAELPWRHIAVRLDSFRLCDEPFLDGILWKIY